jgi:hypothetical protein
MGLWEGQDVRLAILTATRAGSSPALPIVFTMLDRDDGREDHGRVVRTSGRRGICRRDHARRRSPAHFESRDYVLRAALPRAPGRRPRSSGQKMDLWSSLHDAISRMVCDEERPKTELSKKVRRHLDHVRAEMHGRVLLSCYR